MAKQTGQILFDGDRATIIFERWLPYPIEKVWKAITDPEQRKEWFGPTSLEPREGGAIELVAEGPPARVAARVRLSFGIRRIPSHISSSHQVWEIQRCGLN